MDEAAKYDDAGEITFEDVKKLYIEKTYALLVDIETYDSDYEKMKTVTECMYTILAWEQKKAD